MGKNKNKSVYLSSCDRTIIAVIASFRFPKRKLTDGERLAAQSFISESLKLLTGKAYRVARCVLDKSYQDTEKVHNSARTFIIWAENV